MSFKLINKKITPIFLEYAEIQARKIALIVIRESISSEVQDNLDIDNLFITEKDTNGKITSININPIVLNDILGIVSVNVRDYLYKLEAGNIEDLKISNGDLFSNSKKLKNGVIFEIPSGIVFDNILLSNLGPKIPVKLNLIGEVTSDLKTNITNYGINNALIEIFVNVKVYEQVILPYTSKQIEVETDIPIAMKLLQGDTPGYYYGLNSNLTIPQVD